MKFKDLYKKLVIQGGLSPLLIFLTLTISCGGFFMVKVPFMWSADGGAQVTRAFQIAQKGWRAQYFNHVHGDGYGGYVPRSLDVLRYQQLGLIGKIGKPGFERLTKDLNHDDAVRSRELAAQPISKEKVKVSFVNTAAYSPAAYAPAAIGIKLGIMFHRNLGQTLLLGRLLSLLTFIVAIGYGLYTLRETRFKWIIFTVSLLPLVIFQASLITADSMLFTVILLFSSLLIKSYALKNKLTTLDKVLLCITALLIPLVKSVYTPLLLLLLLIPKTNWKTKKSYSSYTGLTLLAGAIGFVVWSYMTKDIAASNGLVRGDTYWQYGFANQQLHFVVHHPIGLVHAILNSVMYQSRFYVDTTFGWLGFNYLPIPGIAQLAGFLALGLCIFVCEPAANNMKKYGIAMIMGCAVVTLIIFTTLYITYTIIAYPVVEGVQGRYLLPLFPALLAGIALLFGNLRIAPLNYGTARNVLVGLVTICLVLSTIRYGMAILV